LYEIGIKKYSAKESVHFERDKTLETGLL